MSISISHSIDSDDLAFAIAGLEQQELERFAAELVAALDSQAGDALLDAFANAIATQHANIVGVRTDPAERPAREIVKRVALAIHNAQRCYHEQAPVDELPASTTGYVHEAIAGAAIDAFLGRATWWERSAI